MLTIVPPPPRRMAGITARQQRKVPVRFTAQSACQSAKGASSIVAGRGVPIPAALTSASTRCARDSTDVHHRADLPLVGHVRPDPPRVAARVHDCPDGRLRVGAIDHRHARALATRGALAVASPIPDAPPVTMATQPRFMSRSSCSMCSCPRPYQRAGRSTRQAGSAAPPDRLLEVADPRGAPVEDHLAELVEDRRRRGVDQGPEQRQLDHRALALRDGQEARHVRRVEIGEQDAGGSRRPRPDSGASAATGPAQTTTGVTTNPDRVEKSSRQPSTAVSSSVSPTSSSSSRSAARDALSPGSIRPPGSAHCPAWARRLGARRVRRNAASPRVVGSRTAATAAGRRSPGGIDLAREGGQPGRRVRPERGVVARLRAVPAPPSGRVRRHPRASRSLAWPRKPMTASEITAGCSRCAKCPAFAITRRE